MGTPVQPVDDAFEQAMRRKRMQEELARGVGGAPAPTPSPSPTPETMPAPAVAQPPVDHLSVAKLKQSMGAQLTPEEEAALAAEALAQPAQQPGPAAGEEGFLGKLLGMVGLGR